LHAVPDLPKAVQERLYFLRFEDLMEKPAQLMSQIFQWLELSPMQINPEKLVLMGPQESDSHYGMKFPHRQSERLLKPKKHDIPPRIQAQIERLRVVIPTFLSGDVTSVNHPAPCVSVALGRVGYRVISRRGRIS
jgi:hypothetical protein